MSVVGTRPQLIKEAALHTALRFHHDEIFIDTGQHYDDVMAGDFFEELDLPRPDHSLGIGPGSQVSQVGTMMLALEPLVLRHRPDAVLVYGDTNSTLAGAMTAAKLRVPVAHVEAGLRSFDRRMPEETNRVIVDHLSTWCFAPTLTAVSNLASEGITSGVLQVGDVLEDLAARNVARIRETSALRAVEARLGETAAGLRLEPGGYVFATIHRAENRSPEALAKMAKLLARVGREERPVVLSLHPGTAAAMSAAGIALGGWVRVIPPVGYRSSLTLQLYASAVITDSGGVQREASWLGTPCLVVRLTTEWVEMVSAPGATSVIVGLDADRAVQELAVRSPLGDGRRSALRRARELDLRPGRAAQMIAESLAASM